MKRRLSVGFGLGPGLYEWGFYIDFRSIKEEFFPKIGYSFPLAVTIDLGLALALALAVCCSCGLSKIECEDAIGHSVATRPGIQTLDSNGKKIQNARRNF